MYIGDRAYLMHLLDDPERPEVIENETALVLDITVIPTRDELLCLVLYPDGQAYNFARGLLRRVPVVTGL